MVDAGISDGNEMDKVRLNADKIPFHGRKEELEEMHGIYDEACKAKNEQLLPVTLISGFSGTGKSTLVKRLLQEINIKKSRKCFSICGKFNQLQREAPFSAIVEGLSVFSSGLLTGDAKVLKKVKKQIKKSLGEDAISVLTAVAPNLIDVFGRKEESYSDDLATGDALNHLKHVFLSFINAISSAEQPVVMHLDDLQWIDSASLDLITSLLIDTSIQNVMFIGSCRSNEVDEEHILSKSLMEVSKFRTIKRIDLLNLSMKEMGDCICDLLKLNIEKIMPLAKVIFNKTEGNIFFAIQVLEEFERKKILNFSKISYQWEWDLTGVENEIGYNIVDIVISKIKSLPEKLQNALTVAAHTNSQVDIDTVQILMQRTGCVVQLHELEKLLDLAVLEGMLVNTMGSTIYKFAHDRIRQAAHLLLPPGEKKDKLKEKIGSYLLLSWLAGTREDWMLFVAADHLNGISWKYKDAVKMTILNLEIGERSIKIAAFAVASEYLKKARVAIQRIKNHWKNYYDICLRLYRALTEVELILGHYEIGNKYALEVFDHIEDPKLALPTYRLLAQALSRQEQLIKSIDMCWHALELVGETRNSFKVPKLIWHLIRETRYFKNHSDEEILSLPKMTDKDKLAAMSFYNDSAIDCIMSGNISDFIANTLRRIHITKQYGLCIYSAAAFINIAPIIGHQDHNVALRFARLARKILKVTNAKKFEPTITLMSVYSVEGWSNDYAQSVKELMRSHKVGMELGEIAFAINSWSFAIHVAFMAGKELPTLLSQCNALLEQEDLYGYKKMKRITAEFQLRLRCLIETECDLLDFDELGKFKSECSGNDEVYRLLYGYSSRLVLAVYFGNYTFVEKWVRLLKAIPAHLASFERDIMGCFYSGLALLGLARSTGNKKYILMARREANQLNRLNKAKQVKDRHRYLIMKADLLAAATNSKFLKVKESFEIAFDSSIGTNHRQDAALCSELAGEYFLSVDRHDLARTYFTQAKSLYYEWGAIGKVNHLQKKRSSYLGNGDVEIKSTTIYSATFDLDALLPENPEIQNNKVSFGLLPKNLKKNSVQFTESDEDATSSSLVTGVCNVSQTENTIITF